MLPFIKLLYTELLRRGSNAYILECQCTRCKQEKGTMQETIDEMHTRKQCH